MNRSAVFRHKYRVAEQFPDTDRPHAIKAAYGPCVGDLAARTLECGQRNQVSVLKLFLQERIIIVEARVVRLYKRSQAVSEEQDEAECFAALQLTSVSTRDAARLRGYIND